MKQTNLAVSKLRPFENNPYQVRDDAEMNALIESIQEYGILTPLIVRPIENTDEYEVISCHRRLHAAQRKKVPPCKSFLCYVLFTSAVSDAQMLYTDSCQLLRQWTKLMLNGSFLMLLSPILAMQLFACIPSPASAASSSPS